MALETASNRIKSSQSVKNYRFAPAATTATAVAWVDARKFGHFLFGFFRITGTSALTFAITANTKSDGSGTSVTILTKDLTGIQPDAVGDQVWQEVSAEEIKKVCVDNGVTGAIYVTATLTFVTGTDVGVVTYVQTQPRFTAANTTADAVS